MNNIFLGRGWPVSFCTWCLYSAIILNAKWDYGSHRIWRFKLVCFAQVRLHYAPRSYPVRLRLDWADSSHINRLSVFFFLGKMWSDLVGFFQHKERLVVGNRKQHLLSLCFRNSSVKTGALNPGKSSSSSLSFNFPDTVCLCFRPRMCSLLLWRLLKYWLHGLQ